MLRKGDIVKIYYCYWTGYLRDKEFIVLKDSSSQYPHWTLIGFRGGDRVPELMLKASELQVIKVALPPNLW